MWTSLSQYFIDLWAGFTHWLSDKNYKGDATRFPRLPEHRARTLVYTTAAIAYFVGAFSGHYRQSIFWAVPFALIYPHFVHIFSINWQHHNPNKSNLFLLLLDALFCGIHIVLVQFSAVPCLMYLLLLNFIFMNQGGTRLWIAGNVFIGFGVAITYPFIRPSHYPPTPDHISFIYGIGVSAFIILSAYYNYLQTLSWVQVKNEMRQQQQKAASLSRKLSKYVSPQVWESIFSGKKDVRLETQRKILTVFFSDIKGFTDLTEELEAEQLTDLLNNYLTEMSNIALKYGGTIDKFSGDSIMIFFGDPNTLGAKKDAQACVAMSIEMRRHMTKLQKRWRSQGILKPLEIRMGVSTGYCTVGNFGTESRMDYTIIGKHVNLASRLESKAEPSQILISHDTYSLVKDLILCQDKGQVTVKGFSKPETTYQVIDFRKELGADQGFLEQDLDGFSIYLDTQKIKNYDKSRIIKALEKAKDQVSNQVL